LTPHQLVAVAIRVFVLWYALFLLRELPPSFMADLEQAGGIAPAKIGIAVVLILFAFVLWVAAGFIARAIVPSAASETPLPWTESRVLTIGSSLIGLWVISYSMSPIIYYGTLWFLSDANEMHGWQAQQTISLASAFVVFAVGLWLFLGARGLWQVWARLRGRVEN
jgi:hypothetical protein